MTHRNGTLSQAAEPGVALARRQTELFLWGHDLRAALSDMTAGLESLRQSNLPDLPRGHLDRARAAADTLAHLVDLALAQTLDAPLAMSCPPEDVALVQVLDRIEARWTAPAMERGRKLMVDLAPATPGVVVTDRISLERILSNLVSNAVIHADQGPIRVTVTPGQDGGPVFSIIDAGPGLPARVLARASTFDLPEPPTGLGEGQARQGLGLFIARDLARRIGADLTLSNRPAGGVEARLALPAAALPVIPVVESLPDLSGLHILLAESSTSQGQAATALLQSLGARVTATADARTACDLACKGNVDAVLMGAHLPDLPGNAAISAIRRCPGPAGSVPVLAVTATADAETHAGLRAAGADGVLVKPIVCPVALGLAVLGLPFGRMARETAPPPADEPLGFDPVACDPALLDRLILLVGPDAAGDLCDRICADLAALRGGIDRSSAPPVDTISLRRHAHGLIALAGTCGATGLHAAAQHLHQMAESRGTGPDAALMAALDAGFAALFGQIGQRADRIRR
jgi:two-component system, OmpR family, aerobic respiration control sensor histidine kinase ArcB